MPLASNFVTHRAVVLGLPHEPRVALLGEQNPRPEDLFKLDDDVVRLRNLFVIQSGALGEIGHRCIVLASWKRTITESVSP